MPGPTSRLLLPPSLLQAGLPVPPPGHHLPPSTGFQSRHSLHENPARPASEPAPRLLKSVRQPHSVHLCRGARPGPRSCSVTHPGELQIQLHAPPAATRALLSGGSPRAPTMLLLHTLEPFDSSPAPRPSHPRWKRPPSPCHHCGLLLHGSHRGPDSASGPTPPPRPRLGPS